MIFRGAIYLVNRGANSLSFSTYIVNMADKLNAKGDCRKSIEIVEDYIENNEYTSHDRAICANILACAYQKLGDIEKQKENLLISSIADLQSPVREYISLRQLAVLLFKEEISRTPISFSE